MTPTPPDPAHDSEALAGAEAPHDWCPECDGPGQCQPGMCCGRPYPELGEAERQVRALARCRSNGGALVSLLAEYDRRGAELARTRAFLLEATGTLPVNGFTNDELGDPWVRWVERVAAYLTATHR